MLMLTGGVGPVHRRQVRETNNTEKHTGRISERTSKNDVHSNQRRCFTAGKKKKERRGGVQDE